MNYKYQEKQDIYSSLIDINNCRIDCLKILNYKIFYIYPYTESMIHLDVMT